MNVFDELNNIFRFGYNNEELQAIKPKLEHYLTTCPEEGKPLYERKIELVERLIKECKEVDKLRQQYNLFLRFCEEQCLGVDFPVLWHFDSDCNQQRNSRE